MRRLNFFFLLPVILLYSCSKDSVTHQKLNNTEPQTNPEENDTEIAFPNKIGMTSDIYFAGQKLPVEEVKGIYIYQGDILLKPTMASKSPVKLVYEQGEVPQKSTGRPSGTWPDNKVYYQIDDNLPNKDRVKDAIKHWKNNTSLKFIKRTNQSDYIYFTSGGGCSSYIGMIGGRQEITLAISCSTGNTIHEIGHAVGLWHEQSRVDRDKHITIHYENIQSGRENNFDTYAENGYDGEEFTSNLDFNSIMLYSPYSFSKNGQPTITKLDGSLYYAQRNGLSSGDIEGLKGLYPKKGSEKPSYINGEYYTISGLTVLRSWDRWYYLSRRGWRQVSLFDGTWMYV